MCTSGVLRTEVVSALTPFWKNEGEDAADRLKAIIDRLNHNDRVTLFFRGKHAAKSGMMLRIVRPIIKIDHESQIIIDSAIATGHWGHTGEATLYATVTLPADPERAQHAKRQFAFLMSQSFAGLCELKVNEEDSELQVA